MPGLGLPHFTEEKSGWVIKAVFDAVAGFWPAGCSLMEWHGGMKVRLETAEAG
jgi:hypothetical protein